MNRLNNRRISWGVQDANQVHSNILIPHPQRNLSRYDTIYTNIDQGGEGFMDWARSGYQTAKKYLTIENIKKAGDLAQKAYASELGKKVQNLIPSSDDTARDGFPGEKHAILKLPNGKMGIANYMGPGTNVVKRLERGDPPRTESDKVAQRHDIDYALAKGLKDRQQQALAIREADKRMVKSLQRLSKEGKDSQINIQQGMRLIQGKMALEEVGKLPPGSFGGDLKKIPDKEKILLMSKRAGLSQEGFGPAGYLKQKLLKGKGLGLAGGAKRTKNKSMGKSYGTSKGHAMKGGFFALLTLLGTAIAEAVAGITATTVATSVITGGISAAAGALVNKAIESGDSKKLSTEELSKLAVGAKLALKRMKDFNVKTYGEVEGMKRWNSSVWEPFRHKSQLIIDMYDKRMMEGGGKKVKVKTGKIKGKGLGLAGGDYYGAGLGLAGSGPLPSTEAGIKLLKQLPKQVLVKAGQALQLLGPKPSVDKLMVVAKSMIPAVKKVVEKHTDTEIKIPVDKIVKMVKKKL